MNCVTSKRVPSFRDQMRSIERKPYGDGRGYAAVTEGIRERNLPEIKVGDELPRFVARRGFTMRSFWSILLRTKSLGLFENRLRSNSDLT